VSGALSVPVSTDQSCIYTPTNDAFFTGYASQDLGPVHADLNLGVNQWRIDGMSRSQPWGALALSMAVNDRWTAMAETYVYADASPLAPQDGGLLFALAYAVHPWLIVDGGGDIGAFPETRKASVFIGVTWIPAVLWRLQPPLQGKIALSSAP
jgi:hypothetical protein